MRFLLAVSALALAGATPALAQDSTPAHGVFKTGKAVYELCASSVPAKVETCDHYLMAAYDMASYFQDTNQITKTFCVPKGTSATILREKALGYWKKRPESMRYSAVSNIINILDDAYPGACK